MPVTRTELQLGHSVLSLETGKLAKQANGSVVVRYGDTVVLVAAVQGGVLEGRDFFPLTVDYREKVYAAGKFPGGFIKREGRPSTKETLTSRLIDRPIRPLFPADFLNEVQVMCMVLSSDKENDPDILAMIGSSAALHVSNIPLTQPTGSVRVGRVKGQFVVQPTHAQMDDSDLDLIVSGTRTAVAMIEGFAREVPEDAMAEAIAFAHMHIVQIIDTIEKFRREAGLGEKELPPAPTPNPLLPELVRKYGDPFKATKRIVAKLERYAAVKEFKAKVFAEYAPKEGEQKYPTAVVSQAFAQFEERVFREIVLSGERLDGRQPKQLRKIEAEAGILPRVHGSALFTRGETQALVVTTLGTVADEQRVDGLGDEISKKFMLDYNFPPFSVGEAKPIRGPGRREIGHGMLAERSLASVLPNPGKFPYTIRLVSEILESNGSSSMASVCGGTLALMDAGVPISNPVAGISVGLVKEPDRFVLLTDIQGDEDHYGDMDFKIAGTQRGITGIQLDLKIEGIGPDIIRATLDQAREGRREILRIMLSSLRQPRANISDFAPRLIQVKIDPSKIGLLIGPGGKNIKAIQEATGAKIDIDDDGTVSIAHMDAAGAEAARMRVLGISEEVKVGKTYEGKVTSVKEFGAFIEIVPGRDGLCHVSELDDKYVSRAEDVVKVGDKMTVKVISIDDQDRVKLSRKAVLREAAGLPEEPPQQPRGGNGGPRGGGDRDRGDRDRDRPRR